MHRYAVFFGDVALDEYYSAPAFPAGGDKLIVQTLEPQFGGMVANAAATFAHLGGTTTFMSQLNSGALTQRLLANLRELGIYTDHVIIDDAVPDSKCIIVVSGDQHIVIIPALNISHTELTPEAFEHVAGADFLFTTLTDARPFRMGELSAVEVFAALRDRGVRIAMDLDVYNLENHPSELIEHTDVLFMNRLGFSRFVEYGNDVSALLAGGAEAILVTRDGDGCEVHTREGVESIAGHEVDVVDVTGAGDTFSGSFLYAYQASGDLSYSARFANASAAMSTLKHGGRAGMTSVAAVEQFMKQAS